MLGSHSRCVQPRQRPAGVHLLPSRHTVVKHGVCEHSKRQAPVHLPKRVVAASAAASEQMAKCKAELDPNTKIIFVLGGPGSGKGTQCAKIAEKYNCVHLSTGDLLRDEVDSGSELGKQCDKTMKEGGLVDQEVIIGLVRDAMLKSGSKCFLIDGFPRELSHADTFEEQIMPCKMVLSFDCPFDVLEQRLKERAKSSDRSDDNPETMRKRFDTFQEQSKPVIDHYTKQGRCHHISAVDGPDEIFQRVCAVLDKAL